MSESAGAVGPTTARFPTDPSGLPECQGPEVVELRDGEEFDLRIGAVAKRLNDVTVRMLAYNGSIPGPVLRVQEGSEVTVNVVNEGDTETTVHWHGLRLDNRYDGTHETQAPIAVGGQFTYRITFPDPGVYWYHPHIREDHGQELGLYGNILVVPSSADYWPAVNREVVLTLDDVLIEDGQVAPFSRSEVTYAAMGRYGNVMLTNGELDLSMTARQGEVVRFYLTDTANTRVFNIGFSGATMKHVGGDSGRYEQEQLVEGVLLAPSERAVVDVLFDGRAPVTLEHRTPDRVYPLATIAVSDEHAEPSLAAEFGALRTNAEMAAERERIAPFLEAEPDKTVALVAEMDLGDPELPPGTPVAYTCPMHPDVFTSEPGRCPKCGMKLVATEVPTVQYVCPMHPEVVSEQPDRCPKCGMKLVPAHLAGVSMDAGAHGHEQPHDHEAGEGHDHEAGEGHDHEAGEGHDHEAGEGHSHDAGGIEWEDDMVEFNRTTTSANMRWKLIDRSTGAEGQAIDWRFRVGDQVKIRLVNEMDSDHPMHHPFHIHGAGRFLILSRDGVAEPNLVWKDTVLVPTGQVVDILLDVTNPGMWMAHCHIAEHHESGMMFRFVVDP